MCRTPLASVAHSIDPAPLPDDRTLVARIRTGDLAAFEALFRAYHKPLGAFVLGYVDTAAAAEDIVQDVFFKLWQYRARWELRDTVQRYLYGAVRNAALNYARHQRVVRAVQDSEHETAPPGMGQGPAATDERVRSAELREALARAVAALPDRCREAYLLRLQHDLSYTEVAGVMGLSVKRVEFLLTRAHKMLREALKPFL